MISSAQVGGCAERSNHFRQSTHTVVGPLFIIVSIIGARHRLLSLPSRLFCLVGRGWLFSGGELFLGGFFCYFWFFFSQPSLEFDIQEKTPDFMSVNYFCVFFSWSPGFFFFHVPGRLWSSLAVPGGTWTKIQEMS